MLRTSGLWCCHHNTTQKSTLIVTATGTSCLTSVTDFDNLSKFVEKITNVNTNEYKYIKLIQDWIFCNMKGDCIATKEIVDIMEFSLLQTYPIYS